MVIFCQIFFFVKNGNFFLSKMVILCPKLRKIVIVCQKIIQKLVFLGQFNAFLKKKLQKLSFLFNLMFVVEKRTKNGNFLSKNDNFFLQK